MTKVQYMKKVRELARTTQKDLIDVCWRLLHSGAIDLTKYDNDYCLPKVVMSVACEKASWNWTPLSHSIYQTSSETRYLRRGMRRSGRLP